MSEWNEPVDNSLLESQELKETKEVKSKNTVISRGKNVFKRTVLKELPKTPLVL